MPLAVGELTCVAPRRAWRRQHPSPMECFKPKLANVYRSCTFETPHTMKEAAEEVSLAFRAACPTERALAMVALLGITLPNILVSFLRRHSTQSPLDHEIAWLGGAAALLGGLRERPPDTTSKKDRPRRRAACRATCDPRPEGAESLTQTQSGETQSTLTSLS